MADVLRCPKCEAVTRPGQPCWLCRNVAAADVYEAEIVDSSSSSTPVPDNPYAAPSLPSELGGAGWESILLIVGLVAVLSALFAVAPGHAVLLAMVTLPALVRTVVVIGKKSRRGETVSRSERSMLFFASVAGVIAAGVTAGVAFLAACTAACFGILATGSGGGRSTPAFEYAFLIGALVAVTVGGWTLYGLWRKRDAAS